MILASREAHGVWLPPLDIYETREAWIVHMELPGVAFEDIELTISRDTLRVSGSKQLPTERLSALRLEIYTGPFGREIQFPDSVDVPAVTASMEAGLLTVRLPRVACRNTRIPISTPEET